MTYCKICGEEKNLSEPKRYWDPDDGYVFGRLCQYCLPHSTRKPKPEDYAYRKLNEYGNMDSFIDTIYG